MPKIIDITGRKFNRLTAVSPIPGSRASKRSWLCKCDCGKDATVSTNDLVIGNTKSCGCYKTDLLVKSSTTHGGSVDKTKGYNSYHGMIKRCTNPNNPKYDSYGARGISVCDRWVESFENFMEDMGPRPSINHSVEGRDNDGNYEKSNCYWGTPVIQARNRRSSSILEFEGVKKTVAEWGEIRGIPGSVISKRIKRKWSVADALMLPLGTKTVVYVPTIKSYVKLPITA